MLTTIRWCLPDLDGERLRFTILASGKARKFDPKPAERDRLPLSVSSPSSDPLLPFLWIGITCNLDTLRTSSEPEKRTKESPSQIPLSATGPDKASSLLLTLLSGAEQGRPFSPERELWTELFLTCSTIQHPTIFLLKTQTHISSRKIYVNESCPLF